MQIKAIAAVVLAAAIIAACAAATEGSGDTRRDMNVLTRAEIEASGARNLYELIDRERPRWFQARGARSISLGAGIAVYQDNTPLGTAEVLRQMSTDGVHSLRYLDPSTAQARLPAAGTNLSQGAIQIMTRADR